MYSQNILVEDNIVYIYDLNYSFSSTTGSDGQKIKYPSGWYTTSGSDGRKYVEIKEVNGGIAFVYTNAEISIPNNTLSFCICNNTFNYRIIFIKTFFCTNSLFCKIYSCAIFNPLREKPEDAKTCRVFLSTSKK